MSASDALGAQWRFDHEDRGERGGVVRAYQGHGDDQQFLGRLDYDHLEVGKQKALHVKDVFVEKPARQQGVARQMYGVVRAQHPDRPFAHDVDEQSESGYAMARRLQKSDPAGHKWADWDKEKLTTRAPRYLRGD